MREVERRREDEKEKGKYSPSLLYPRRYIYVARDPPFGRGKPRENSQLYSESLSRSLSLPYVCTYIPTPSYCRKPSHGIVSPLTIG